MPFTRINSKMVEARITPGQRMFSQRGAMLAYRGRVTFTPSITGGQGGVMSMIGRRVADEATPLMTVELAAGTGRPGEDPYGTVMFGFGGHHIHTVDLADRASIRATRSALDRPIRGHRTVCEKSYAKPKFAFVNCARG